MQSYVQAVTGLLTPANFAAAKAAPATDADGVDITGWKTAATSIAYPEGAVLIDGSGAGGLTGPVQVCGYDPTTDSWHAFHTLNGGGDIALTATLGFMERFEMPVPLQRLTIVPVAITGGINVSDRYMPVSEHNR
jgi:hypothetical protein